MTYKEISTHLLKLREEALRADENQLGHVKAIHRRLDVLQTAIESIAKLASLPECCERQELFATLETIDSKMVRDSAKRLVANHESAHEKLGLILENLRTAVEGTQDS